MNGINEMIEIESQVIAKPLFILIGYRKVIAKRILESKGEDLEKNVALLNEANEEMKKLLILD